MIKDTTLRLSPGTPKVDTPGAVLPYTNRQFSMTASQTMAFIAVHIHLLYPLFQKKQGDMQISPKNMLLPLWEKQHIHIKS
jgi:hypothetical protein